MAFPLGREEWYQLRDDRTNKVGLCDGYQNIRVGIIIDPQVEASLQIQAMVLVATNSIVRWCRNIKIDIREDAVFKLNCVQGKNVKAFLQKSLLEIDPYLRLELGRIDKKDVDQILIVGSVVYDISQILTWINCDGWVAGIGRGVPSFSPRVHEDDNIIGASFAACLGCAELFRQAIGGKANNSNEQWYSLLDFQNSADRSSVQNGPSPGQLDIGYIHQIGCGAIGSSFDYLLSLTKWKFKIALIDYDPIDYTNCNRSLLFTGYDAAGEKLKTKTCAAILNNKNVIYDFKGSYSDFIRAQGFLKPPPDLILCFANEGNIWSDIQNNYPPIVFHSTTTPNWGVNFGRHIPKKEGCILCRFSKEAQKLHRFVPKCGTGIVSEEKNKPSVEGVLPFLSPVGAILVMAELAKMTINGYPINKNFVEFSFKSFGTNFLVSQAQIEKDCVCNDQSVEVYSPMIKGTKYWYLVK